jgi:glycosyltransferase involved in cell wall biosynthesis
VCDASIHFESCATIGDGKDVGQSSPPRVVMLVANNFRNDSRVFKEARSLTEWGCSVHVLAMAASDLSASECIEGINVERLPATPGLFAALRLVLVIVFWWNRALFRLLVGRGPDVRSQQSPAVRATAISTTCADIESGHGELPLTTKIAHRFIGVMQRIRAVFRRICRAFLPPSVRMLIVNRLFAARSLALRPDVLHCHDLNTLLAGAIVRRLTGVRLMYDSHELFLERNIGDKARWKDRLVWGPIERLCIHRCDSVISVAQSICDHLQRQYGVAPPHLVRNLQPYESARPPCSMLHDELGILRNKSIVMYPGAITVHRGLEIMIDSATMVRDAVYVIMGHATNPAYLDRLKNRAATAGQLNRTVFFRDAVPMHRVVEYLACARLGIVPTQNVCLSYFYESSNKIFHCIMAGVPLVMSDHAEKRAIIEAYEVGVLVNERDPSAIANAVNSLLADTKRYDRLRANCLRAACTLNWEHEEFHLRSIYATLLGERAFPVPPVRLPNVASVVVEPSPARETWTAAV